MNISKKKKYKENLWSGYKTMFVPEHLLESIYSNPACNVLQVDTNEYINVVDRDENTCDLIKWDGNEYRS